MFAITSPKKILIIEDSLDLQFLLRHLLLREGFNVETAIHGLAALHYLESTYYDSDLILLDIMMPIMNGYAFRKHQERHPQLSKIPTLILSADESIDIAQLKIKKQNCLKKPIDSQLFLQRVNECLKV